MTQHIKSHNSEADPEIKQGRRFRAPQYGWFHYLFCTIDEADMLQEAYLRRGVRVELSLNADRLTWTVSVYLPVRAHLPRTTCLLPSARLEVMCGYYFDLFWFRNR